MPDGSRWDVPAEIVARSYAAYYAKLHPGSEFELERQRGHLFRECMEEPELLTDWAEGNMNWEDVSSEAKMIQGPDAPDYQEGWVNGAKEVVSHE